MCRLLLIISNRNGEIMKNMNRKLVTVILLVSTMMFAAKSPQDEATLKQKVFVALQKVSDKSVKVWGRFKDRFKGFFMKRSKSIYESCIIPMEVKPQQGLECG